MRRDVYTNINTHRKGNMFSIVLVCLDNFQEYIIDCIKQLIRLGHTQIYIITNNYLFSYFDTFGKHIQLISVESLEDPFQFQLRSKLDRDFRGGFWHLTSSRFFVIHAFMKQYNIEKVIHLENDVLIYYNCDEILTMSIIDKTEIYLPFDSYKKSVASIMYIPDATILGKVLENYDIEKNDMYNFSIARENNLIRGFPIWIIDDNDNIDINHERQFVSENANEFYGFIFDAAAIGQYVGGVDPRNIDGDTRGFINEECVIKYGNEGTIIWETQEIKRPYFIRNSNHNKIPVFNLHIHSKNLAEYM